MIEPFIVQHENNIEINQKAINMLKSLKNPHVVIIIGKAGEGKSTTLNQLIDGLNIQDLQFINSKHFKTGYTPSHITEGCDMYFSVKLHDLLNSFHVSTNDSEDADIIFVDTEGFDSLDGSSMFLVPGILTILQLSTEVIYFTVSCPSAQNLRDIRDNEKLTTSLKNLVKIQDPEKVVYGAKYNLNRNYNKSDPLEIKKRQLNDERYNFQRYYEEKLQTKTILGPFDQENQPDQHDPILHVYWDSLKDLALSIKESVIKRGQQDGYSMANSIKTLFDFFKEYGNSNEDTQDFNEIVKHIFIKSLEKQIGEIKQQIESRLDEDYSLCIKLKAGEEKAANLILHEISAKIFQNIIPSDFEKQMNTSIQYIENIADLKVNSHVQQFLDTLKEDRTVQALADKSIQYLRNKQFQENVDMSEVDEECDTDTIISYVTQEDKNSRLTVDYLFARDNQTITREINDLNTRISKTVQAEYHKLPIWKNVIYDIRDKAYQRMNQDNNNKSRKKLKSYKDLFLNEIKGQYELDPAQTNEVKQIIQDVYNSTKPPQTYQKKEVWRRKVIEKKPKSKQVLQYAAKGLLAPGVSLALFPYCIMHKENFREAVSQTLDEAAEELTSFIPNEKEVIYVKK